MRRNLYLSVLFIGTILLLIGCRTSESVSTEPVSAPLLEEAAVEEAAIEPIEFTSVYDDPLYQEYKESAEAAYANPSYFAQPTLSGTFVVNNENAYLDAEFSKGEATIDAMLGEASFELTGFGRESRTFAVRNVQPTASGPRVEYQYRNGIVGWYINGSEGLQQGWTIPEAPARGDGDVILEIEHDKDLVARLRDDGSSLEFLRGSFGLIEYKGLLAYDALGNKLPSVFEVGENGTVLLKVDDRRATYPITVDPLYSSSEFFTLTPADFADSTAINFGWAVDLDWPYLIVGAPQDNNDGDTTNNGGAWYMYRFDDNSTIDAPGSTALVDCDLLTNGTSTATADGICDWDWYTEYSEQDHATSTRGQLGYDVAVTALGLTPSAIAGAPNSVKSIVYARNGTSGDWDLIDDTSWNEGRGFSVDIDGNYAVFAEWDSVFTSERSATTGDWGSFGTTDHYLSGDLYVSDVAICGDTCTDGEEYVIFGGGLFFSDADNLNLLELEGSTWTLRPSISSFLDNTSTSEIGKSVDIFGYNSIVGIPNAQLTNLESAAANLSYTEASNTLTYNVPLGLLKPFSSDSNAGQSVSVGDGPIFVVYGDFDGTASNDGFVQIFDYIAGGTSATADLLIDDLEGNAADLDYASTGRFNVNNTAADDGVVVVGNYGANSGAGEVYTFHAQNDLSVSVSTTASDGLVSEGGAVDYTITVINNGPFTDHNIEVDLDFLGGRYASSATTTNNSSLTDSNGDVTYFNAEIQEIEGIFYITGGRWVINTLDSGELITLTVSTTLSSYETCNADSAPGGTALNFCNKDGDNQYDSSLDGSYEDESILQADILDHYLRDDDTTNNDEFARVGLAAPQLNIEIGYSETEPTLNEEVTVVVTVTNNGNLDLGSTETVTLEVDLDTLLGSGVLALAEDTDDGASPEGDPIVYYKDTTDENYGTFVASGDASIWTIPGPLLIDQSVTLVVRTVVIGQGVSFIQIENENRTATGYVNESDTPFPFPITDGDAGDDTASDTNQVCDQSERIETSAGSTAFGECTDITINEVTVNLVDVTVDVEDDVDPIGFAIENIPGPFVIYTITVGNDSADFEADELVLAGTISGGTIVDFEYAPTASNDLDDDGLLTDESPNPFIGKCNESGGAYTCRLIEGELIPAGQAYEIYVTAQPDTTAEQGSSEINFFAEVTLEAAIDEIESNNSQTEITAVGNSVGEDAFEQNDSFDTLGTIGIITEELDDELDLTHFPNWNVLEDGIGAESDTFYFAERDVFRAEASGLITIDFEPLTSQPYHLFVALLDDVSTNVTSDECGTDGVVGGAADTDLDGDDVIECGDTVIEYGVPSTFNVSTASTVSEVEFFGSAEQSATIDLGTQATDFYVVVEPCAASQPQVEDLANDPVGGLYIFVAGRGSGSASDCSTGVTQTVVGVECTLTDDLNDDGVLSVTTEDDATACSALATTDTTATVTGQVCSNGITYDDATECTSSDFVNTPGAYNLTVSSANTATNTIAPDDFEENDVVNSVTDEAQDISTFVNAATPTTIEGLTIAPANDPDFFFFDGQKESEFEVLSTSLGTSGTDVTVYDPSLELEGIVATTQNCLVYDDNDASNDLCVQTGNSIYECIDNNVTSTAFASATDADAGSVVCELVSAAGDVTGDNGRLVGTGTGSVASTLSGTLDRDAIYYVEVLPIVLTELFKYELLITTDNDIGEDPYEDNDTLATSTDFNGTIALDTLITDTTIAPTDDVDWFNYVNLDGTRFQLDLQAIGNVTGLFVTMVDSTGNEVSVSGLSTTNGQKAVTLDYTPTEPDVFFFEVLPTDSANVFRCVDSSNAFVQYARSDISGSAGIDSCTAGSGNTERFLYTLQVTTQFDADSGASDNPDQYEENDTIGTATNMTNAGLLNEELTDVTQNPEADDDFWYFQTSELITVTTTSLGGGLDLGLFTGTNGATAIVPTTAVDGDICQVTTDATGAVAYQMVADGTSGGCTTLDASGLTVVDVGGLDNQGVGLNTTTLTFSPQNITQQFWLQVTPAATTDPDDGVDEVFPYFLQVALGSAGGGDGGIVGDGFEENDTAATAANVESELNSTFDATIFGTGDPDYYTFETSSNEIEIDILNFGGEALTVSLLQQDASTGDYGVVTGCEASTSTVTYLNGTGTDCSGSTSGSGKIRFEPTQPGTYVVGVVPPTNGVTTYGYKLLIVDDLDAVVLDPSTLEDPYEENDDVTEATDITSELGTTITDTNIDPANDEDWFRVQFEGSGIFRATALDDNYLAVEVYDTDQSTLLYSSHGNTGTGDATVNMFPDASIIPGTGGDQLATNSECESSSLFDKVAEVTTPITPASALLDRGNYYVRIVPCKPDTTTTYTFFLDEDADGDGNPDGGGDGTVPEDPYEQNDTASAAFDITSEIGTTLTDVTMDPAEAGEEDWFQVLGEGSIIVSANALDDNQLAIEVYDVDGSTLLYSSGSGTGTGTNGEIVAGDQETSTANCDSTLFSRSPSLTTPTTTASLLDLGNYYIRIVPCNTSTVTEYFLSIDVDTDGDGSPDGGSSSTSAIITLDEFESNNGFNDIDGGILGAADLNTENRVTLFSGDDANPDVDVYPFFGINAIGAVVTSLGQDAIQATIYRSDGSTVVPMTLTGDTLDGSGNAVSPSGDGGDNVATGTNITMTATSDQVEGLYFLVIECGESAGCSDTGFFYDFEIDNGGLTPDPDTDTDTDTDTTTDTSTDTDTDTDTDSDTSDGDEDSDSDDEEETPECEDADDIAEDNDNFSQAFRIAAGNTLDLSFDPGCDTEADVDYFSMTIKTDIVYTCETSNLGTGVDTSMVLYGPSADTSNQIVSNDDIDTQSGEINSRVTFTAGYSGTVYILIQQNGFLSSTENADYTLSCFTGTAAGSTASGTTGTGGTGTGTDGEDGEGGIDDIIVQLLRVPTPVPETESDDTGVVDVSVLVGVDTNVNDIIDLTEGVNLVSVRALNPTSNTLVASGFTDPQGNVRMIATINEDDELLIVIPLLSVGKAFRPNTEQQDYVLTLVAGTAPAIIP